MENVSITVSGTALDVPVPRRVSEINNVFPQKNDFYGFDYTLSFQFKDGKVRINAPSFDIENILYANPMEGRYTKVASHFKSHFYSSSDIITVSFEKYLNDLVTTILKKSETINNW